jgi:hypothetical protein
LVLFRAMYGNIIAVVDVVCRCIRRLDEVLGQVI